MIFNIELEQDFLGCLLLEKKAYFETLSVVKADDFYDPVHREIFEAMAKRFENEQLVSPVTMRDAFIDHDGLEELGGAKYLVRMAGATTGLFKVRDVAKELKRTARKRELFYLLKDGMDELKGEAGADEVVGKIEAGLIAGDSENDNNVVSMLSAVSDAARLANDAHKNEGVVGVTTGLTDLDRMTGGFQAGELILLGGRPSMGKTAVAVSMALSAARRGQGVCISSLEMTPDSLALRAVTNEAATHGKSIAYTDAKRGSMTDEQAVTFFESAKGASDLPIEILPSSMRDMGSIYAGVKKSKRILEAKGTPLSLIVVDYLQLISGKSKNRFEQIAEISIALKGLALRMGVPVLALSQLSRALESRDNKRPMLSDLRESGQLEQDADMVIFCYRHEYYLEREEPDQTNLEEVEAYNAAVLATRGKMELIVSKQRMGEIGTVHVGFNPATNYLWDEQRYPGEKR